MMLMKIMCALLIAAIAALILFYAYSNHVLAQEYIPTYTPTKPGRNETTIQQDSSGNWNINSYNYNTNSRVTGTVTKTGNGYIQQLFDTQTYRYNTTTIIIPKTYGIGE